jgi:hypothetical protein
MDDAVLVTFHEDHNGIMASNTTRTAAVLRSIHGYGSTERSIEVWIGYSWRRRGGQHGSRLVLALMQAKLTPNWKARQNARRCCIGMNACLPSLFVRFLRRNSQGLLHAHRPGSSISIHRPRSKASSSLLFPWFHACSRCCLSPLEHTYYCTCKNLRFYYTFLRFPGENKFPCVSVCVFFLLKT